MEYARCLQQSYSLTNGEGWYRIGISEKARSGLVFILTCFSDWQLTSPCFCGLLCSLCWDWSFNSRYRIQKLFNDGLSADDVSKMRLVVDAPNVKSSRAYMDIYHNTTSSEYVYIGITDMSPRKDVYMNLIAEPIYEPEILETQIVVEYDLTQNINTGILS